MDSSMILCNSILGARNFSVCVNLKGGSDWKTGNVFGNWNGFAKRSSVTDDGDSRECFEILWLVLIKVDRTLYSRSFDVLQNTKVHRCNHCAGTGSDYQCQ